MICESGESYTRYKKSKKPKSIKRRILVAFIILSLIIASVAIYFDKVVNPQLVAISEAKVRNLATRTLNDAFTTILSGQHVYDDLVEIRTDTNGNITSIIANTHKVNTLAQTLVGIGQDKIGQMGQQGIPLPLGNFTGIALFAGRGPDIRLKIMPIGNMVANFYSHFRSAGINQTNHQIFVKVTAFVNLILPIKAQKVSIVSELLIAESIIVGRVPEVYLNLNTPGSLLNLAP